MENQKVEKTKQITKTIMSYLKKNLKTSIAAIVIASFGSLVVFADYSELPQATAQLEEAVATQVITQAALDLANQNVCLAERDYAIAKLKDYHNDKYELEDWEDLIGLTKVSQKTCGVLTINETSTAIKPSDLYYTFLKSDGASVSQSPKEHFGNNKYMATDVATNGRKLQMYAPSFMYHKDGQTFDESREYTVKLAANYATMGETVELHWEENGVSYNWAIGHFNKVDVENGAVVSTGDEIGVSGGCPGELKLDEKSTGCHIHIELWIDGQAVEYPLDNNTKHNDVGFEESGSVESADYDISKLAYSIAMAETNDCTTGMGKTKNNCFGIMEWPGGVRQGIRYDTKDDAYAAFSELWQRSYDTPLTFESVFKWVYGPKAKRTQARIDGANQYLSNALFYYNQ